MSDGPSTVDGQGVEAEVPVESNHAAIAALDRALAERKKYERLPFRDLTVGQDEFQPVDGYGDALQRSTATLDHVIKERRRVQKMAEKVKLGQAPNKAQGSQQPARADRSRIGIYVAGAFAVVVLIAIIAVANALFA